jgi:WD40 repeat protein
VVRRFGWPQQGYSGLSLSSSGTRGVTYLHGPPGKFQVFDWSTEKAVGQHDPGDRVLLTSDGRYVLRQQGTPPRLRAFDARTGKEVNAYPQLRNVPLIHLMMSRNGKSLLCSEGPNLKVYDVDSGKEIGSFDGGISPKGSLSGDGRRLLATAGYRSILNVWDVRTRRVIARLRFPEPLEGGNGVQWQFSVDGQWAAFAGPTESVYVFRLPAPGEPAKAALDKARDRR